MHAHQLLPPKPPRKRSAARWHIGEKDVVSIYGIPCKCIKSDPAAGYVFARLDDPKTTFPIDREEFNDLQDLQSFDFERDGLDSEKKLAQLKAPAPSLMELSEDERHYVLWKSRACEIFLEKRGNGEASLYGPKLDATLEQIQRQLDEEYRNGKSKRGGRQRSPGHALVKSDQFRKYWLPRYLKEGPLGLADRYQNCGRNKTNLNPEEYEILIKYTDAYLSPERPSIAGLWRDMDQEIGEINAERRRKGLPDLRVPDDDRLRIEINRLPKYDVAAARYGEEYARNLFRPVVGGVPNLTRPMQRVEADDWTTHLYVIAAVVKLWEPLSPELKKKAETARATLSAAMCCTTRCLPAVTLSLKPEAENTRTLLRMSLSDKTAIARDVGCETPWEYRALMDTFVFDEGSAYLNNITGAICTDLTIGFKSPQAEMPRQRGKIERFFQTLDIKALARFAGRAFNNPQVRGKYEAQARACVTLEELAALIVRFIVDQYHNAPHAGLGGETPRACWLRLSKKYPPTPPPGRSRLRIAFGRDFTATVQASGIEIFGNWYQSREVQEVFETHGNCDVTVRVDSEDLGAISMRRFGGWVTVLGPEIMHDVSLRLWDGALADLRRQNKDLQDLVKPIVHRAIAFQKMADEETRKRLTILYRRMTPEECERARKRMSVGVRYREEKARPAGPVDMFADAVAVGTPASPNPHAHQADEPAAAPAAPKKSRKTRRGTGVAKKSKRVPANKRNASTQPTPRTVRKPRRKWTFKGR